MKQLIKEIPYIRLLICLIAGIFFAYRSKFDYTYLHVFTILFSLLFLLIFHFVPRFYKSRKLRWLPGVFMFFFLFSTGWLITRNSFPSKIDAEYEIVATGKIKRIEHKLDDWNRIIFRPEKFDNYNVPFKSSDEWILIVRNDFKGIIPEAGKMIGIKGILSGHSKPDNPDVFDYGAFLYRSGISGQMFIEPENIIFLDEKPRMELYDYGEKVRNFSSKIFSESGISGSSLGILNALILGERSGITREINDAFVRSGAVHMLAVSGMHVGIVYIIINFILNFFFKSNSKTRMIIAIISMFGYAFITGFSPSVNRAVVMFSFMQIGKNMTKDVNSYNMLCSSAFFILLFSPTSLFDAGFWLSYLAVAGIVAFMDPIENLVKSRFWLVRETWKMISISIAAQLGVLPVLLYLFGAFPIYFLISNLLVLPIITPATIAGIVLLPISQIPILSDILVWILSIMLKLIELLVTFVDSLPYSYLDGIWVSIPMIITLYFLIISIYKLFDYVSGKKIIHVATATVLTLLIFNIQYITKTKDKFIVFNTGNQSLIELINTGKSATFASAGLTESTRNFTASVFERKNVVKAKDFIVFDNVENSVFPTAYKSTINGNEILMLSGGDKNTTINEFEKPVDILVINGKSGMNVLKTIEQLKCKSVVFASSCPTWSVKKWIKELENSDVKIHNVRENGAFLIDL